MAVQTITDPMLLDSTGHGIIEGLEGIKNAVQPINIYVDVPITIPVNGWSATTPHQYTWTNARITTECGIEVHFSEGAETVDMKYLEYDKILGGVQFEIDELPDKDIPLIIRIINASTTAIVDPIDAAMVETSAVPSASNVEQALGNHETRMESAEESIEETVQRLEDMLNDLKSRLKSVNGVPGDENGNVEVNETEFAHQIVTDDAQQSYGEFVLRTTGGDASLSDGPATLVSIDGRAVHTGEVADSLTMVVNNAERTATPDITAEIDNETFIEYVGEAGVYTILFTTAWSTDPALYGITVTNTPEYGDRITTEWDGTTEPNMTVFSSHVAPPEITATIDQETFEAYVQASGTYTLSYTTEWSADPALYGVTVTNSPISGDNIVITYTMSDRGTITVSNPTSFVSTGWNLYDNSTGKKYAHVKKYSTQYGFMIGGSYASLQFSETLDGAQTSITPASGYFTVPSDGYVWVTGGDDTTYILMTWSDWTEGYEGEFQSYTESVVDLSDIMENFPYGLLQVGAVSDEINFSMKRAISRIERLAYSSTNLAYAKNSGRPYDADTNYIYLVKETEDVYIISENGAYTAADHGLEFVTGSDVPVYIETLYGQNLVDKLRTDVVTKSQDLVNNLTSTATNKALAAAQGKALNDSITTLNSNIANISGRMSYESLSNVQDADLVNTIKGFLNNGSKGGVFLASRCTNTPDSTKYYKIRFTKLDGSVWIMLEAWNTSDTSLYYISEMNPSTSAIASWKQYALKSDIASIGTITEGTNTTSSVSVSNNTAVKISTITLTSGTYILIACVDWAANETGYRQVSTTSPTNPGRRVAVTSVPAPGTNKQTYQQLIEIVSINDSESIDIYGIQTSGAALTAYPYVYAVRIK